MLLDDRTAYAEVEAILNILEDEYMNKIPQKVRKFFSDEKIEDYRPVINVNVPLTEQNLKRETMILLAILNLNYWCENKNEKQEFLNELSQNENERKKLEEKYSPDNLFKNKKNEQEKSIEKIDNVEIIKYKKNIFCKLQEWFENLVKKIKHK